ncbi:MAG: MauE/DoxX family redox-associated membrane protein [Flavobacterium sp.]|uniref:MauE/DoxX family redox-associated membrane protein n=1 Tax=Flavobacterium sp. TaxID=239 RepID=UPI0032655AFC
MEKVKSYLPWAIRILISFLFIISAIAKMYPSPYFAISTFEVKQLYPLGFSENIAPWFSRILIGIELALGILILQNNFLRKLIIPVTILLLAVFIGHLSYVTFATGGNSGNCGCFGELIPMTPIQAIIKNIIAVFLLVYLFFLLPKTNDKNNFWIVAGIMLATIISIFLLAPIKIVTNDFVVSPIENAVIDSTKKEITAPIIKDSVVTAVKVDSVKKLLPTKIEEVISTTEPKKIKSGYAKLFSKIDTGRKTLCFFVPGCDHCRQAAKELTELKQKNPNFPEILIIFMNEEANLIPDFFKEAGAEYPYKIIEIIPFWNALGTGKDTPGVKYIWNGNTYKYYNGITDNKFNPIDYQELINKPYSELKK